MQISSLLQEKGQAVFKANVADTVQDAFNKMVYNRVGSLLVMKEDVVKGIITERDIIRRGLKDGKVMTDTKIETIMTQDVVIATPEDSLQYVMGLMTRNRIRHVPVFDKGTLVGLISIGDVVFALLEQTEVENRILRDYISGSY
jgi:CBS domain-containing protein